MCQLVIIFKEECEVLVRDINIRVPSKLFMVFFGVSSSRESVLVYLRAQV